MKYRPSYRNIQRLYSVLCGSVYCTNGGLDYRRVTEGIIKLCELIIAYDSLDDINHDIWYIDDGYLGYQLSDFIEGVYQHYVLWHGGKSSKVHEAFSQLSLIYTPNYELNNAAFENLNEMREIYSYGQS